MPHWVIEFGITTAFITILGAVASGLCAHSLFNLATPLV